MYIRMGHAAFRVTNLKDSMDFYCAKLGLKPAFNLVNEKGEIWIQYLEVTEGQFIELFPINEGEIIEKSANQSFTHVSLQVENMVEAIRELRDRGIKIFANPLDLKNDQEVEPVPSNPDCGSYCAWLEDPDHNYIELMQLTPHCKHNNYKII